MKEGIHTQRYPIYINGNWVEGGQWLPVVNPADGKVFAEVTAVDREKSQAPLHTHKLPWTNGGP